nr:MAG TPA: hypothetical protein [Caudoviricetes sp.]
MSFTAIQSLRYILIRRVNTFYIFCKPHYKTYNRFQVCFSLAG